jgi:hypothetical protein
MYIEDAVLETTTMTSSMSAEYGRFAGGIVNMVTKTGGNEFSGSFRANLTNDSWNGETPLTTSQADEINTTYEATFGGYLWRDKLWFFLAGRDVETTGSGQLVTPGQPEAGVPYPTGIAETRIEGKVTWAISQAHRVMLSYIDRELTETNNAFFSPADNLHIDPARDIPFEGLSFTYSGVFSDSFFLEGLYSKKDYAFVGGGGDDPSLGATPIWDLVQGVAFNAPLFCGVCDPKERNNENIYAKASLFVSGAGTHDLVFGVDVFDDINKENNDQSATGYIWAPFSPQDYDEAGNPYTHIDYFGGYIIWGEVLDNSVGSSLKTNSLYVNDTWRTSDKFTINLGLRYDKNDGKDQAGAKTVDDYRISPRLSAAYDIKGDGRIILMAGANRYVTSIMQNIGSAGAEAGEPTWAGFFYLGDPIYAGTAEYPTNADALDAMFDWFFNVYGGPTNTAAAAWMDIPGLSPKVAETLRSPYGDEFTLGASFRLGTRGVFRADYVYRKYGDFYTSDISPNRTVTDPISGAVLDLALNVNNDSLLSRKYNAIQSRFDYRLGSRWTFGANYTYSKSEGNFDGETSGSGPVPSQVLEYREYKDPAWNTPEGYLGIDQRHKFRGWVVWDAIASTHHNLSLSLLQSYWSGAPYEATGSINTVPYVGSPSSLGYAGNPGNVTYFFSDRGEFRTDNVTRTDVALNYSFFINVGGGQLELFLQPEVLNVFNEQAVVDTNTSVQTAVNSSSLEPFDPWTTEPVEGIHWRKGSQFGEPANEGDFQTPRTFRFSVGLRF